MKDTRFIEKNFPVEAVSQSCSREKSIRQGHISTLQTWWARRPLAVCRAAIFLALMPSVENIKNKGRVTELLKSVYPEESNIENGLMQFAAELADFKNSNDEKLLHVAKQLIHLVNDNPSLADTFSGGGSIPLEAIRLGLKTFASELNPIAATGLSLALKLAPGISDAAISRLCDDVKKIGTKLRDRTGNHDNGGDVLAYFWARTYDCPHCGHSAPLIQSKWLSKTGLKRAVQMKANRKSGQLHFTIVEPITEAQSADADKGTVSAKSASCAFCEKATSTNIIQEQGMNGRLGEILYAKYVGSDRGKEYLPCNQEVATEAFQHANAQSTLAKLNFDLPLDLNGIRHLWAIQYGVRTVGDLFNPRQRATIEYLAGEIAAHKKHIERTSESKKETLFRFVSLIMILNKVAIYSNRHSWWQANGAFPANIFVRQAISMVWNYVEIPAASPGAGGWASSSKWIVKALENLKSIKDVATVERADAEKVSLKSATQDLVVIDPPYFDSITYAYLSDFFYPWMKPLLSNVWPDWYAGATTPKSEELIVDRKHKLAPSPKDSEFFRTKMARCLAEARRVLRPNGIVVLMYGHKDITAWLALFQAMTDVGLRVTTSWPIHTERSSKFKHSKVEALGVSCILVLRPQNAGSPPRRNVGIAQFRLVAEKRMDDIKARHPQLIEDPVALSMSVFPLLLDDYMHKNIVSETGQAISIEQLLEVAHI